MKLSKLIEQSPAIDLDFDDLLGDFYEEYFGGLYEDLYLGDIVFLFPQCSPKSIAIIEFDLALEGVGRKFVDALLGLLNLPPSKTVNYLGNIDGLSYSRSDLGGGRVCLTSGSLLVCIDVGDDQLLLRANIYDTNLIAENSDEFEREAIQALIARSQKA